MADAEKAPRGASGHAHSGTDERAFPRGVAVGASVANCGIFAVVRGRPHAGAKSDRSAGHALEASRRHTGAKLCLAGRETSKSVFEPPPTAICAILRA